MSFLRPLTEKLEDWMEIKEPITPIERQDVDLYLPSASYVIRPYSKGQTRFIFKLQADPQSEAVVLVLTKLKDGSVTHPHNIAQIRWCGYCRLPVMRRSILPCQRCGRWVCEVCSPMGLCRLCRVARFLGME